MKIIEPSAELYGEINPEEILRKLEICGKVSRQSELGDAENFVRSIIKRGHESVLEHASLTFKIVCDRAIMAELTRHRLASFTVESTRYVKYDELTIIKPDLFAQSVVAGFVSSDERWLTEHFCQKLIGDAEDSYQQLISEGYSPEIARAVLPQCTATTIYMTANLRELRHILKLRCDRKAHPQMRKIMLEVLTQLHRLLPVVVEDIWEVYKDECN